MHATKGKETKQDRTEFWAPRPTACSPQGLKLCTAAPKSVFQLVLLRIRAPFPRANSSLIGRRWNNFPTNSSSTTATPDVSRLTVQHEKNIQPQCLFCFCSSFSKPFAIRILPRNIILMQQHCPASCAFVQLVLRLQHISWPSQVNM